MARDPYKYFRMEARQLLDQLGQGLLDVEKSGTGGDALARLLRLAHTLKGASRVVRQAAIADQAHAIEDLLTPLRDSSGVVPPETISALLALLDGIANRVRTLDLPTDPETPPRAAQPGRAEAAVGEDRLQGAGVSMDDLEALLEDVGEAYAQLGELRHAAQMAAAAQRSAQQLGETMRASLGADATAHGDWLEMVREFAAASGALGRRTGDAHARIDREIRQVREAVEQLRLAPAGTMFPYLERIARDSAQLLGKAVLFEAGGADIRVEAGALRVAQDALTQMVRNAVAHGIESPAARAAVGKPAQGRVMVSVERRGRLVVFRCRDDGGGIDVAKLTQAAAARDGSVGAIDPKDSRALAKLLLRAGVSTSTVVTEVAGRGIGMDIVRDAVARLRGDFGVETTPGHGSALEIVAPESVSSIEALHVESGGLFAAIPLTAVRHAVRLGPTDVHRTAIGEAIVHEGRSIPLLALARALGKPPPRREGGLSAVIVAAEAGLAAIGVTRISGVGMVVTRALPELAAVSASIAGASIDADGQPLLLLDPEAVAAEAYQGVGRVSAEPETKKRLLVIDDSLTTRMLEQSILESAGYDVDLATSGEEGLERAHRNDYALILCDVEMPGMDGFSFVEEIRRDPGLRDVPAILVTSRNAQEDKRRGSHVGAQGYVVKSEFDQDALLAHIRQLVAA